MECVVEADPCWGGQPEEKAIGNKAKAGCRDGALALKGVQKKGKKKNGPRGMPPQ